jgi:hypothetical protein
MEIDIPMPPNIQIDPTVVQETAVNGLLLGPLLLLPLLLISLLLLGFWVWMLVDCLMNEPSEGNDKLIWAAVIFFGNWLGATLHYFARRPLRMQESEYFPPE